jgi:hypothetical protein
MRLTTDLDCNITAEAPEQHQQYTTELQNKRSEFRQYVRRLRSITKSKERSTRLHMREMMLKERGSASFWTRIASFDARSTEDLSSRAGHETQTMPDINSFARHFADIAIPPTCALLDDDWKDSLSSDYPYVQGGGGILK